MIRNRHIIDGTGSPRYSGDVAIHGGKIAAIGNLVGVAAALHRRSRDGVNPGGSDA
ncbi:MAG: hypothetical protein LAQ69_16890 [Acidobacteriia bacterium]|nr:hypothetical protein [Terriglobia bacterium]